MNKTIDISLGKILFHLNDTAYYKLRKYLDAVRLSLKNSEDTEEVMSEIEVRIAELLLERQTHPQQVIDETDIDEIISVLGQPEDYQEEVEDDTSSYHVMKKLFRDPDHAAISGVTSGMAHFFGIDISIMRIIFIILLFVTSGSFGLIYILLWIVIPKAESASDKLKMKGERVNIDNIVDYVKTDENSMSKKKINLGAKVENATQEIGNVVIKIVGLFIAIISGVALISIILSVFAISPFSDLHLIMSDNSFYHAFNLPLGWLSLLTFIIIGFPVGVLFMLGLKMLMPHANISGNIFWIGGTIWLISILFIFVKGTSLMAHKNISAGISTKEELLTFSADTLQIETSKELLSYQKDFISRRGIYYYLKPSKNQHFSYKIEKSSEGIDTNEAIASAKRIVFNSETDSIHKKILFSSRFSYPQKDFIQDHKIRISIFVPEGKFIEVSQRIRNHIEDPVCHGYQYFYNKNGIIECVEKNKDEDPFFDEDKDEKTFEINGKKIDVKVNEDGIDIHSDKNEKIAHIKIDKNGIKVDVDKKNKENDK